MTARNRRAKPAPIGSWTEKVSGPSPEARALRRARAAYRDAGVDVELGEAAVERIRPLAEATRGPEVIGGLGGFAGLYALGPRLQGRVDPVLVAGTDGVGTKLALAEELGDYRTVGIDLVAMCVNDVAAAGGDPLFFLDYLAAGRLEPDAVETVITSMTEALKETGTTLLGGEMAEMPGFYPAGRMDLAGFCVGLADRADLLGPHRTRSGDLLVGLGSSGLHSNGFSLVRSVLDKAGRDLDEPLAAYGGASLGSVLLTPTRLYTKPVAALRKEGALHAAAHITGGGFPSNLVRILPSGTCARVDLASWQPQEIFALIGRLGHLSLQTLLATFNLGIGCVLAIDAAKAESALARLRDLGEDPVPLGHVATAPSGSDASAIIFVHPEAMATHLGVHSDPPARDP